MYYCCKNVILNSNNNKIYFGTTHSLYYHHKITLKTTSINDYKQANLIDNLYSMSIEYPHE